MVVNRADSGQSSARAYNHGHFLRGKYKNDPLILYTTDITIAVICLHTRTFFTHFCLLFADITHTYTPFNTPNRELCKKKPNNYYSYNNVSLIVCIWRRHRNNFHRK